MLKIYLFEWLSLALKFFHVIVGIAWIGASFYFNWLENKLNRVANREGIAGHLWAVHGGGFYYLEKYKKYPQKLPETLHWFKWEAYLTWISGFSLLIVIYYFNASAYLLTNGSNIEPYIASLLSILGLILIWIFYDLLCKSSLIDKPSVFIFLMISSIAFSAYIYSLVFNPRAVYLQVGAMLGTIMAANVFFVIIPVQKVLVRACEDKANVSSELGKKGYIRSRHNNYITLPVIFTMISGHYPIIYSSNHSWLVLLAVFSITVMIRHYFNLKGIGEAKNSIVWAIVVSIFILIIYLAPSTNNSNEKIKISNKDVQKVINIHCTSCHSTYPSDDIFKVAPAGLVLDTEELIYKNRDRVYQNTVVTKNMPFNNKTNMTEKERKIISDWYIGIENEQN
jgi:uncharacterized membrane protein